MRPPLLQFLLLFVRMSLVGSVVVTIDNLVAGISLAELWKVNLKSIGGQIFFFVTIFLSIVWLKLRAVLQVFGKGETAASVLSKEQLVHYGQVCLKLPFRLFQGFIVFGLLASLGFHFIQWRLERYDWEWLSFLELFVFEQALVWLLALMLYSGTRRILRPVLSWLAEDSAMGLGVQMSFHKRIIGVILGLTFMTGMDYLSYILYLDDKRTMVPNIFVLFVLFLVVSYYFARSAIDDTVNDINQVRKSLADYNRLEFPQSTQRLKVESADEIGDLKVQFNSLQEKAEQYYKILSQELALAYRVQASLLPSKNLIADRVKITGRSVCAADLGGDFYDYTLLDEQTAVIIIGDVSGKGLPSALVTATVLGLFRAEVQHGGSPSELLHRIHASLDKVLMPGMYATAAILMVDCQNGSFQYASAGHLPPIQHTDQGLFEWETASFPLGFGVLEPVAEIAGVLKAGDTVVLYTDGILEAQSVTGEIVGFERLHAWLEESFIQSGNVIEGISEELARFRGKSAQQDDETMVVLQFCGETAAN